MPRYLHGVDTLAGDDEPVFTFRASDPLAAGVVREWAEGAEHVLGVDRAHLQCVRDWADQMDAWRRVHGERWPHAPMDPTYQAACRRDREAR